MEFDHLGRHCSVSTCKQRDFLPFYCGVCKGCYCLEHKAFVSHGCDGETLRDMTSINCPICNQTVKYNKAQDVEMVWNDHYNNSCSQTATVTKVVQKCASKSCRINLGPSNKFSCPSCSLLVCLSHRAPEDHDCSSLSRKSVKVLNSQTQLTPKQQPNIGATTSDNRNPLRNEEFLRKFESGGHSSSRKQTPKSVKPPNRDVDVNAHDLNLQDQNACPLCGGRFPDPVSLVRHFELSHPEPQNIDQTTIINTDSNRVAPSANCVTS